MKRIKRNPEKYEVMDLYSALGRKYNYNLNNPESEKDFLQKVSASLKESKIDPQLIHGKRIEALFAYVVSALGGCIFLKQEDSGDVFCKGDIIPPDYRIINNSGEKFFVEVKNCHNIPMEKEFTLQKKYLTKISDYAKLNGLPLKIAVHFSRMNKWFLLSPESFDDKGNKISISFVKAYAKSEMAIIGDRELATTPDLMVEFRANPDKSEEINGRETVPFTIQDVIFSCNDKTITNQVEKNIAFYLMRYGSWIENKSENIIVDNRLIGIRFSYSPEMSSEGQDFQMIGSLSEMVNNAYSEATVTESQVVAIDTNQEPQTFSPVIPEGYKGDKLPLWQFTIQPNHEFKG